MAFAYWKGVDNFSNGVCSLWNAPFDTQITFSPFKDQTCLLFLSPLNYVLLACLLILPRTRKLRIAGIIVTVISIYLDVVDVKPCRRELETLSFKNPLSLSIQIDLLLPALHLPLQALHVSDKVDGLRGRRGLDGLLLHVPTRFWNLQLTMWKTWVKVKGQN